MNLYIITHLFIAACWLIFLGYWSIQARQVKPVSERKSLASSLGYRLAAILGGILIWSPITESWLNRQVTSRADPWLILAAACSLGGLLTCIWARRTLAGNWSGSVTFKENHELIQTGPYRWVRHPIYTGLLLLVLGSAMHGAKVRSWLGLLLFGICFGIKIRQEEALMRRHFPETYPGYAKRVKALIPFLV
ncbi:MAG TPA: isoprenylcysteine carboxylmethyltransferase family protein [Verrucomicrobiae bacterium]